MQSAEHAPVPHVGQKRFQRLLGMSPFPPIATELLHHTKVVGGLIRGARGRVGTRPMSSDANRPRPKIAAGIEQADNPRNRN
jgi:hypothetical protein